MGILTWQVSILKTDHVGPQHPKNLYIDIRTLILNSNGRESKVLWKKWSLFQVAISIWCYIVYHKHVEDEPILTHVVQMGWYLVALLWKWNMLPIAHQNAPNTRNLHWGHLASFEWTSWLRSCDFMNWYPNMKPNESKWLEAVSIRGTQKHPFWGESICQTFEGVSPPSLQESLQWWRETPRAAETRVV